MSDFGYSHPIAIRFNDLDGNGHVNNTVFTDYLQEARINYMRDLFAADWRDASVVVATMTIDFLAPIHPEDEVFVDVAVVDVGTSSWTIDYRVRVVDPDTDDGRVAAEASSVQVAWDREAGDSRDLPPDWRTSLEEALDGSESPD